eukprot:SAG11_NODE_19591_length_463_cov_1.134615_1_plen_33_part_10
MYESDTGQIPLAVLDDFARDRVIGRGVAAVCTA